MMKWVVFLCALVALGSLPGRAAATPAGTSVTLLTYNVRGLFRLAARDDPAARSRAIGRLAADYDVTLLQEDFEYHDRIASEMAGRAVFRGNGMGPDPRRIIAKLILFPAVLLVPHFSPPYGAGLTTIVDAERFTVSDVVRAPYRACSGWIGGRGDCWATKGFLRLRIVLPDGGEVDVYNTHLDAGTGKRALATRRRQLERLEEAMALQSADRAVIVGGDFNCVSNRKRDRALLDDFRARVGLGDAAAAHELDGWRERDYVFYRSGRGIEVSLEEAGEAREFVMDGRALSDHPALYVRFRATPVAPPGS